MKFRVSLFALLFAALLAARTSWALPEGVTQALLLPPGKDNPRNSEGDFIRLKDGRLLFIYTHFTGASAEDGAAAHLASRSSTDCGKAWTDKDEIVIPNEGKLNVMSVSLLRLKDGRIALFYLVKNSGLDCRARVRFSSDEAKTWSDPIWCQPEGSYVVNNARVTQLSTGRLIMPTAIHAQAGDKAFVYRAKACCFYSDDAGATWKLSKTILEAPPKSRSGLQEPLAIELKEPGKLMMLCRTDQGSQLRSYSNDAGDTWSEAEPTDIKSPLSPASVARIATTGDLLLVWNDHSDVAPALKSKRTPLAAAISKDDGKTWEKRKLVYDDPTGWYCYTAITFVDGNVLLGHCAGIYTGRATGLATSAITRFPIDWLYK